MFQPMDYKCPLDIKASDVSCTYGASINSNVQNELTKNGHYVVGQDTTTDWNNIITEGLYPKLLGNSNPNNPESNNYFYCVVFKYSNEALTQIAVPYSTGFVGDAMYFRTLYSTTWSKWFKLSQPKYVKDNTTDVTQLPFNNGVTVPKVIFSIKLDNLDPSDVIDIDGMFEVTNNDTYPIMCGYSIERCTSATATSGTRIGGAVTTNVTRDMHHYTANINAIDTGVTGSIYYNLVGYANASGYTSALTVEQNYGALVAKVL